MIVTGRAFPLADVGWFGGDAHNAWRGYVVFLGDAFSGRTVHAVVRMSRLLVEFGTNALVASSLTFDALLPSALLGSFHAGFVELYREGEVIQAVVTCSFFFGSVFYGVRNQDNWVQVERLQFLVWAILSGTTCWLVSVLGQRVHAVSSLCYIIR